MRQSEGIKRVRARSGRRVAVTGMGIVAPNGTGLTHFWSTILSGESPARVVGEEEFSALEGRVVCAVTDFDPLRHLDPKSARRMNRASQMAIAAARMAVEDADLTLAALDPFRVGLMKGTTLDGADWLFAQHHVLDERGHHRLNPFAIHASFVGAASGEVAIHLGIKGPCMTVCSGCASGADAVGLGMRAIVHGEADVVLAGGADAPILFPVMAIFNRVGILSRRNDSPAEACRPFDGERDGITMGEGAAFLVLESEAHALARGAHIRALLSGYGRTCDAHHITSPHPEGESASQAMRLAVREAGLEPEDVDYINAHGTGTELNDLIEAKAIRAALGAWGLDVPVSSTKPLTGHAMGASGAMEAVVTVLAVENQLAPANVNLATPDPEIRLNLVRSRPQAADIEHAATNSFGFGGKNATLVFSRYRPPT